MINSNNNYTKNILGGISFVLLTILLLPNISMAAKVKNDEAKFPGGCVAKGYSFKYKVLELYPESAGQSHSLYFMHNRTGSSLRLFQMRTGDEPYVMHLNNTIRPKAWGVFSSDEKQVKFICAKPAKKRGYIKILDCEKALAVCEYPNVKYGINNYGNYWAVRSSSKFGARNSVRWQGILLRW